MDIKYLRLSQVMSKVTASVQGISDSSGFWVAVEVLKISNGHHRYLELVEYDENRKEVAKSNAMIWNSNSKILEAFKLATGLSVCEGMKILIRARPTFHGIYGLSLTIEEINPEFTLGDMESKIKSIRDLLTKNKWINLNKGKSLPVDFFNVAVISPQDAAGLGDFRHEADKLEQAGLCQFDYFSALFQGAGAPQSIVDAMIRVYENSEQKQYDAVVIIRGGGDKAGLYQLNDAKLCASICRFPLPVMVGIGHERDKVFLEEVACGRFPTPSLLISHIKQRIFSKALEAESNYKKIIHLAGAAIDKIEAVSYRRYIELKDMSLKRVLIIEKRADDCARMLSKKSTGLLDSVKTNCDAMARDLFLSSFGILSMAEYQSRLHISSVMSSNPLSILDKGYGYISGKSGVVSKQEHFKRGDNITINMRSFGVCAKVVSTHSDEKNIDIS